MNKLPSRLLHRLQELCPTLPDAQQRVVFTPVQLLSVNSQEAWVGGLPEKVALITLGQGFVEPGQQVQVIGSGEAK